MEHQDTIVASRDPLSAQDGHHLGHRLLLSRSLAAFLHSYDLVCGLRLYLLSRPDSCSYSRLFRALAAVGSARSTHTGQVNSPQPFLLQKDRQSVIPDLELPRTPVLSLAQFKVISTMQAPK